MADGNCSNCGAPPSASNPYVCRFCHSLISRATAISTESVDGKTQTSFSDGSVEYVQPPSEQYPSGAVVRMLSNGSLITHEPGGTVSTLLPSGNYVKDSPDGTRMVLVGKETESIFISITENPDGSSTSHLRDGTLLHESSDGSLTTFDRLPNGELKARKQKRSRWNKS